MTTKVVLLSGIPGSGKSTLIANEIGKGVVCSADHHFMVNGEYRFDPSQLGEAHAKCMRKFVEAIQSNLDCVVVDNTNISELELAPYVAVARAFGCPVEIVTVLCDPNVAAARCLHGVPLHAVQGMDKRLRSRKLPPFWEVTQRTVGK